MEGTVERIMNGIVRDTLRRGDYFGDFDILRHGTRSIGSRVS